MGRIGGLLSASVIVVLALCTPAFAQDQKKFLEEERRQEMDERPRPEADRLQPLLWDAGGWVHAEFDYLNDRPERNTRSVRYADLRLWGELRIDNIYTAYLRLQTDYTDFNRGDQFAGDDDNVFRSPHVDQAYLEADWTEARRGILVRAGREFVSLGSGLLYNDVAYAIQGTYLADNWGVRGWVAASRPHGDDIDRSLPNSRDSHRGFLGIEADYLLSGDHRAYAMLMVERDFNREHNPSQNWDYNAEYIGLGARGTFTPGLGYSAEAILEFGTTGGAGSNRTDPIFAEAVLLTLDYHFSGILQPMILFQYMFGSGDADRGNPTDVATGNRPGTNDTGFLGFGFVQTGFSLFPRVSNIHIVRFGGSLRPLADTETFHKLEVGTYVYYYRKAAHQEMISDSQSFVNNADIGEEVDLLLRWRIFSDLGFTVNYGLFFPGKAYLEDRPRNFLSIGLTYSF